MLSKLMDCLFSIGPVPKQLDNPSGLGYPAFAGHCVHINEPITFFTTGFILNSLGSHGWVILPQINLCKTFFTTGLVDKQFDNPSGLGYSAFPGHRIHIWH
jgi:hypothetical protein